jgi:hypothetical protein
MTSAQEIIAHFGLLPLEPEGGYFLQSYRSPEPFPNSERPLATAILYLLQAEPPSFSAMHRLSADEVFHFYLGDPVELLELHPDGSGGVVTLGPDILAGQQVQHLVGRGVWQGARVRRGGNWALLGTTMAPGFVDEGFYLGERADLQARYPRYRDLIAELTR